MKVRTFLLCSLCVFLANIGVFAGGITNKSESSLTLSDQNVYQKAISSEASSNDFDEAKVLFEAKSSSDTAYMIRLCSLFVVNAKHIIWPGTKLEMANKGIDCFNNLEAKILAANQPYLNFEFYLHRARTFMRLPDRFKKDGVPYNKLAYFDAKKAADIYENGNFSLTKAEFGRLYSAYSISAFKNNRTEEASIIGEKAIAEGSVTPEETKEINDIIAKFHDAMSRV